MLGTRRRRTSTTRKDVLQTESDSDRPRPAAPTSKAYNAESATLQASNAAADRNHRSSRRPDADQAYAAAQPYYNSTPNHYQPAPAPMATATSSRVRVPDAGHDAYDLRSYLKKRTDRRSPRSSDEKVYMTDPGKPSRSGAPQRSGYTSSTPAPQAPPPASQSYWASGGQPTRDPVIPQIPGKDKERDEARERKRLERDAARARVEEEKLRERMADREREREKERRREEKELRRAEKEREKERERRRDEKEQERLRRSKEKERLRTQGAASRTEPRGREHNPVYSRHTAAAQISAAAGALKHYAESKLSSRHQLTEQIPSSSSNLALPHYATQPTGSSTRLQATTDPRTVDNSSATQIAPPHVPEKDRKRHRSRRDQAATQQNAHESGMSSSEQEMSGRERPPGLSGRRYVSRDPYGDTHQSGPSGSDTDRVVGRERVRKTSRSYPEGYATDTSRRSIDPRSQPAAAGQGQNSGYVQQNAQPSAPVGSTSFQYSAPPIVSIRAGQGPEDPQTPLLHAKSAASGANRARDQQPAYAPTSAPPPSGNVSGQPYSAQQATTRHAQNNVLQDDVSRLHSVLGTTQQAPLPPLPHEAASHHRRSLDASRYNAYANTSVEHVNARPSHTPPSGQLPPPSITPKSLSQVLPNNAAGRSHQAPANADNRYKRMSGSSPGKLHGVQLDPSSQSPAHIAKLSVYRSPGPAVSAEVILPTSGTQLPDGSTQFVSFTQTTVQDLASRFPLNEDVLTSASSSTLAPGTGRSTALPVLPERSPQHQRRESGHFGQFDNRTNAPQAAGPFVPESLLSPNWAPATSSQPKQMGQRAFEENDVPIPIPPRSMSVAPPSTQYQNDLRSQKHTLPPIPGGPAAQSAARPQLAPLQPKASPAYGQQEAAYGAAYASSRGTQNTSQATIPPSAIPPSSLYPLNHSPSRSIQQITKSSPNGSNGIVLGNGTPKHSPSSRLAGRNGSTDTVHVGPGKSSPNHPAKAIAAQPNNNINPQPNAPSRPDMNARFTNATSEYPDNARYRSTTSAYPSSAPPHQTAYLPSATILPTNPVQPSMGHHARSMSQPVIPPPHQDGHLPPVRGQTVPIPSVSAVPNVTPATAPSASAIAAAYRSGLYNADSGKDTTNAQRAPPRTAPSPAPTLTGRSYALPLTSLSKTGFAMPGAPANRVAPQQPPRPNGPPATTFGTHNRSQSDPQLLTQPSRVAVAGHPSTPAPPKAQLAYHPSPSEQELLRTPSSLAPSMLKSPLPPVRPSTAQPAKATKEREPRKKSAGIFGIFRSRSSPPKQDARVAAEPVKTRQRSASQTTITAVAASVRNIIAPHPHPVQQPPRPPPTQTAKSLPLVEPTTDDERPYKKPAQQKSAANPPLQPIVAPTPVRVMVPTGDHALPGGRRSPGTKMFTPFRLLSRRYHTVSSASVEALDGTATNTIIGGESARSSTAGRPSPPLRDPYAATQDWRNKEEAEMRGRGTERRRRPGVVFDVVEEFTDTETHHPARKLARVERVR